MDGRTTDAAGLRLLVVGASSGISHAVATSAAEQGAKVAVAANPACVPEIVQLSPRIRITGDRSA